MILNRHTPVSYSRLFRVAIVNLLTLISIFKRVAVVLVLFVSLIMPARRANADDRVRLVIASGVAESFTPTEGWVKSGLKEAVRFAIAQQRIPHSVKVIVPGELSPDGIVVLGADDSVEAQLHGLKSIRIQQKYGLISVSTDDLADLVSGQRSLIVLEYTGGRRYVGHPEFARWSSLTDSRGRSAILLAAQPNSSLKVLGSGGNFVYLLGANPTHDRQELRRLLEFGLVTREQVYFGSICGQSLVPK